MCYLGRADVAYQTSNFTDEEKEDDNEEKSNQSNVWTGGRRKQGFVIQCKSTRGTFSNVAYSHHQTLLMSTTTQYFPISVLYARLICLFHRELVKIRN